MDVDIREITIGDIKDWDAKLSKASIAGFSY